MKQRVVALLAAITGGSVLAVALATGSGSALTFTTPEPCQTVVTEMQDRPDSAVGGGTWALDQLTRTVEICEGEPGSYTASLNDGGTFTTVALDHTPQNAPQALPAGIEGTVEGTYTASFTAAPKFATFTPYGIGSPVTGATPSTGSWIDNLFAESIPSPWNDDWSWTYTTYCGNEVNEQWVNQTAALGGNSGDITGAACEVPVPATITIYQDTNPETFFDPWFDFYGDLDWFQLSDDGSKVFTVDAGTYLVGQYFEFDWDLTQLVCTGNAVVDANDREAVITVGEGESAACTFTNEAEEEEESRPWGR